MYFYIISCQTNILSTVTLNVYPVNLIIFRGDFEDEFDPSMEFNLAKINVDVLNVRAEGAYTQKISFQTYDMFFF